MVVMVSQLRYHPLQLLGFFRFRLVLRYLVEQGSLPSWLPWPICSQLLGFRWIHCRLEVEVQLQYRRPLTFQLFGQHQMRRHRLVYGDAYGGACDGAYDRVG